MGLAHLETTLSLLPTTLILSEPELSFLQEPKKLFHQLTEQLLESSLEVDVSTNPCLKPVVLITSTRLNVTAGPRYVVLLLTLLSIPMVVVTINILVKHLLLCVELVLDVKSVLLLPEELVESVEARREAKKNKYTVFCDFYQYSLATCSYKLYYLH